MSAARGVDRRTLLVGGGLGVGLIVALAWFGPGGADRPSLASDELAFGAWLKIAPSGRVTVAVPQVETGQGIWTALPQIVADELGTAWEMVGVEPAPIAAGYRNRLARAEDWFAGLGPLKAYRFGAGDGAMLTAAATSVRAFAEPMRSAAAAARAMLVAEAADRWRVEPGQCAAAGGFVRCGDRRLVLGELAPAAAARSPPRRPALRSERADRLIGRSLPRLDGPAKASGKARFAADVRLPDLLYASVRLAPPGGRLIGLDRAALDRAGLRHVAARDKWVAVAADRWAAAEAALHAANPRFEAPAAWPDVRAGYQSALDAGTLDTFAKRGDFGAAAAAGRPLAASYYVAPQRHRSLDPIAATARIADGRAEIWLGTQAPGLASNAGADAVFPLPVGGADGRALENPLAGIAIVLAEATRRPVQVMLPRSAEHLVVPRSPGVLAELSAVLRADGLPSAWRMRASTANGLGASLARLAGADSGMAVDQLALRGAAPPYALEHLTIAALDARPPFATGYMRGSPEREFAFANESFIDELARRKGMEPLAYRIALLGGQPRLAQCLQSAAALAGWDGGGAGSNMGIAGALAFGSAIAVVATASIDSAQQVRAHRLVAAVDCGPVVNPGLATQQVEAALMWGLEAAGAATGLAAVPEILVRFLPGNSPPGGLSGLGAIPLAPAIANAIHAATGKRMRSLPFDPMAA